MLLHLESRRRCTDPNHIGYEYYGGKGVRFLFDSFEQWYAILGPRPTPKHTVDRKDGNGDYSPSNVRYATSLQQSWNRRKVKGNHKSQFKGVAADPKRWRARIRLNGRLTHIGTFDTELDAALAYDRAAREHFKEFACCNFQAT